jgi:hypothetical protein
MANCRLRGRFRGTALAIFALAVIASRAPGQNAQEDLAPCPGSAAEPSQSTAWPVAFCNRTGHDVVLEFHDNDCPAKDWSRRGDVYQRTLRRGESKTFPLCFANEPPGKKPAPGTPTLRIPGGKGVVTTWSVVGDCGERSKPLNIDARTFYDRGEYKSGIILLQYPAGASHCTADASSAASASSPAAASTSASASGAGASSSPAAAPASRSEPHPQGPAPAAGATSSRVTAPAGAAAATSAAVNNRGSGTPTLSAAIDTKDVIARTVRVFAKDGAGYKCNFNLALTFTDGGTWNDRGNADITVGDADAPIAIRKYLKSVSKVHITSSKCSLGDHANK